MLNLSIMPLRADHIDEICEDIVAQQRDGVSDIAMFMMYLQPDGTPPVDRATPQCEIYDRYRERLDKMGAKHGILAQATLGHIVVPNSPYPFEPTVSLITGQPRVVTCCPLDPGFREYIKGQMRILAMHKPSAIMIDDDNGILYKATKGCACKHHMAEFKRRAGVEMTREQLYAHTQGKTEEDKKYTSIYVDVVRDSLVGAVKAMREGIDEIDPKIQGLVSGIYVTTYCEFSGEIAAAFAGEGNPKIARLNGAPYGLLGMRYFTENIFRNAILKENLKGKVDIFLAETDPCPHNRYGTSASHMHMHYVASILEGAEGAKHWITRTSTYEPIAGRAYRKILSENSNLYQALSGYYKQLQPFGCRIPLSLKQNYGFVPGEQADHRSPWSTCVLERFGLPTFFSNSSDGAVFLEEESVDGFDDETIREWLGKTLVLSAGAASKLSKRGFGEYIGVDVRDWSGEVISCELIGENSLSAQYEVKELVPMTEGVVALSRVVHRNMVENTYTDLFPGVTEYKNSIGGKVLVFSGSPDFPHKYFTISSMLNHTRKMQLIEILGDLLPIYYPEDAEIYMRAGYLPDGEIMCAMFNLGFDRLDEIPLVVNRKVERAWVLGSNGVRHDCLFTQEGDRLNILTPLDAVSVKVLFVK